MERPLVVDLDGTLLKTDLLIEALVLLLKNKPLTALLGIPVWLLKGKAALKREVAKRVDLPVATLPYRDALLEYLHGERKRGRKLVLASASDELLVDRVAEHLGLFERCFASDGITNLKGNNKRERLIEQYGTNGFDYAGNDRADLVVWSAAHQGILVSQNRRLRAQAEKQTEIVHVIDTTPSQRWAYLRALRAHHWIKNTLIFMPLVTAHRVNEPELLANALIGFMCFCLLTSGLYISNDLLDIQDDRRHPQKRTRPFASGDLPLGYGIGMAPAFIIGSFLLSWSFISELIPWLAAYFVLTTAYSWRLKQVVLLDVLILASLYMLRILAGAALDSISLSRWLLGFSMFFFLSLALLKRYTEIITMREAMGQPTRVRGYRSDDAELIVAFGSASGFLSVLVMALYVDTATAERLYTYNELIWLICPVLLYWISYLWLMAHRNHMPHDPLVFAVRHRTSQVLMLIMAALFVLAM